MDEDRRQRERRALSDPEDVGARLSRDQDRQRRGARSPIEGLNVTDLCFKPDGSELLVATRGALERRTADGALIESWPAPRAYRNAPRRVAVSPEGSVIAVSNWGAPLALLDREGRPLTGASTRVPASEPGPLPPVHALRFETEDRLLVLMGEGDLIRRSISGEEPRLLGSLMLSYVRLLYTAALSPRRQLSYALGPVGAGWSSMPLLCHPWTEDEPRALPIPGEERPDPRDLSAWAHRSAIRCAALSPDEGALAIGNELCRTALLLLDEAGRPGEVRPLALVGQTDPAGMKPEAATVALAWHPDGERLAAVNVAGDLVHYEAASGRALSHIRACFFPGKPDRVQVVVTRAGFTASVEPVEGALILASRQSHGPAASLFGGDRILAVNGEEVRGLAALVAAFERAPRITEVSIERSGEQRRIEIDLDAWRGAPW